MTAAPFDTYFVCATPRTGSSLLLGLLDSTGVAGHPEAYFRDPDERDWATRWRLPAHFTYRDFVRAAQQAGTTGNGVFGAKLMWGTLEQVVAKLATGLPDRLAMESAFGRLRFIYLHREDTLAQAVSWSRAEQTGLWQAEARPPATAGEHGAAGGQSAAQGQPPRFDREQIDGLVRTIGEHNRAWERWFAQAEVDPYRLTYEQLAHDPAGATRDILDHLGLPKPPPTQIIARHTRQADDLNDDWISRYR
jgi:LPS sulfotransferase NodH